jgi:hypothetical protein
MIWKDVWGSKRLEELRFAIHLRAADVRWGRIREKELERDAAAKMVVLSLPDLAENSSSERVRTEKLVSIVDRDHERSVGWPKCGPGDSRLRPGMGDFMYTGLRL